MLFRSQPVFADLAHEIAARLSGHMIVAHNARFDYGFLKNEFKRCDISFRAPVLCTLKLSRKLFPQHFKHNLDAIIERHQLDAGDRHRAMSDTSVLFQLWRQLEQQFSTEHLHAVVKELTTRSSLPPHLDPAIVDQLPQAYGVYLFYGENRLPIYIGKSNQLRQRVLSHFSADHAINKEMQLSQQVRDIEWIGCAGEVDARGIARNRGTALDGAARRPPVCVRSQRQSFAFSLADRARSPGPCVARGALWRSSRSPERGCSGAHAGR